MSRRRAFSVSLFFNPKLIFSQFASLHHYTAKLNYITYNCHGSHTHNHTNTSLKRTTTINNRHAHSHKYRHAHRHTQKWQCIKAIRRYIAICFCLLLPCVRLHSLSRTHICTRAHRSQSHTLGTKHWVSIYETVVEENASHFDIAIIPVFFKSDFVFCFNIGVNISVWCLVKNQHVIKHVKSAAEVVFSIQTEKNKKSHRSKWISVVNVSTWICRMDYPIRMEKFFARPKNS